MLSLSYFKFHIHVDSIWLSISVTITFCSITVYNTILLSVRQKLNEILKKIIIHLLFSKTVLRCFDPSVFHMKFKITLKNSMEKTCTGHSLISLSDLLCTPLHLALSPWGCPPDGQPQQRPFILGSANESQWRRMKSKRKNKSMYFPPVAFLPWGPG